MRERRAKRTATATRVGGQMTSTAAVSESARRVSVSSGAISWERKWTWRQCDAVGSGSGNHAISEHSGVSASKVDAYQNYRLHVAVIGRER